MSIRVLTSIVVQTCVCVFLTGLFLSFRIMWIQLWISPRFLPACWLWITCYILPGTTRTPTSGYACTYTFSYTPCKDSDFYDVMLLFMTSTSYQSSFPPAQSLVRIFCLHLAPFHEVSRPRQNNSFNSFLCQSLCNTVITLSLFLPWQST